LKSAELPVPTPLYVDQSKTVLGTPYIVIEYIDGKTDFTPSNLSDYLQQFARTLANIHHIKDARETFSYLAIRDDLYSGKFMLQSNNKNLETDEDQIRAVLASVCALTQHNPTVVLHGDYWPGNVLWRDGQLVGVIDWEDAAIGDPLVDVANSRLEILWAFGVEAMQQFTHDYQSVNPIDFSNLPYWDLYAAMLPTKQLADWAAGWIDFGRPDVTEATLLAGHEWFIQHALNQIS
jgi:aminoglycoside phosphotransferase (APT) family kinase protein